MGPESKEAAQPAKGCFYSHMNSCLLITALETKSGPTITHPTRLSPETKFLYLYVYIMLQRESPSRAIQDSFQRLGKTKETGSRIYGSIVENGEYCDIRKEVLTAIQ